MESRSWAVGAVGLMVLFGGLSVADASGGANPPGWATQRGVCKDVSMVNAQHPSGVASPLAGGYNVYLLRVVRRHGVGCDRARSLVRRKWVSGSNGGYSWKRRRSWRSSAGSAYIGDVVGRSGGRSIEFLAVH